MEEHSILKKQQWLVLICLLSGFSNFMKSAVAETQTQPLPILLEKKQENHDVKSFELAHADNHIVLFFDAADSKIIPQLVFTPVADFKTWKFKNKINYTASVGEKPPIIYIITDSRKPKMIIINDLQEPKIISNATCNYQENIRCFESSNTSGLNLTDTYLIPYENSKIRSEVEPIINFVIKTHEPEIRSVLEWNILDILIYNNLSQMGNTETAQVFLEEVFNEAVDFSRRYVFSTFYLPIYRNHGGSKSIMNFMNLLKSYLHKNHTNHYVGNKTLNDGEFVHIWSEATGIDLRYLVHSFCKYKWTQLEQIQFEMAQKTFIPYNYSDSFLNTSLYVSPKYWNDNLYGQTRNLTIRFSNEHVAYYSDESVPPSVTWLPQLLSDSRQYVIKSYECAFVTPSPIFHITLHEGNETTCEYSYFDNAYKFRFAIHCQKVKSNGWDDLELILNSLMKFVAYLTLTSVSEVKNLPKAIGNHESNTLLYILVYDILIGIGKITDANRWIENMKFQSDNYPQRRLMWFRHWFLPIYINFGQTKTLQDFITYLSINWPQKETKREMNLGEFVHVWSGTVRQDLQGLAMETFRWETKYDKELLQARIKYPQLTHLYTPENSSLPQRWTKNWTNYDEATILVYLDAHIACHFDSDINASISLPFKLMSDSWKYAKKKFGPLSYDPILYINLHQKTSECHSSKHYSYFDESYGNRNVIDCETKFAWDYAWNFNSSENQDVLMSQLGKLLLSNARGVGNWPRINWSVVSIFVYDIYKGLGMIEDANRVREALFGYAENIPRQNSFWFRDWYHPIYEKYGEALALNRFLSVLNAIWPQIDQDYIGDYNMGEMVHFWSIAVGKNLWPLADKAFGCCAWDQKTYLRARKEYPSLNYTDEMNNSTVIIPTEEWVDSKGKVNQDLRLVHVDPHFAAYFDSKVDASTAWPFEHISKAWRYAKITYGPFEPGAIFHLLIQTATQDIDNCSGFGHTSYQRKKENRTVLSCEIVYERWSFQERLRVLVEYLSRIVLSEAKQIRNWPAYSVSEWEMAYLIMYDILYEIESPLEAITILDTVLNHSVDVPQKGTFWFRDWFHPIYVNYGASNVLDNFINLLSKHWHKAPAGSGYDYVEDLNVGEFVHFWSGAAGVDLMYLVNTTLKWNHEYSLQLEQAIISFPMITYNDTQYKIESNSAKAVFTEDQFGHSELLLKVYGTSEITVYFDSDVNQAVKWPLALLSKAWIQTKSNFGTVQCTLDLHLNIYLHGKKHNRCNVSLKLLNNTEKRNILDCGMEPGTRNAWAENSAQNRLKLITGFSKIIQHSAKQTSDTKAYDPIPFSQILEFDLFLTLGNFEDAYRMLIRGYNESEIEISAGKFWIRDWYLPLYTQYGGVSILNNFVTLLSTNWFQKKEIVFNQKINAGQNIHFWSASAGTNLYNFSQPVFIKNQQHQVEFIEARKNFPLLNYSCYDCKPQVIEAQKSENQILNFLVSVPVGFAFIVFAAFLIALVIYRRKLRRFKQEMRELTAEEIKDFFEGRDKTDEDKHFCIDSKPFNVDFEISRERLDIDFDSALGSGEFGLVYCGLLKPSFERSEESMNTVVAVKTVKPNVNVSHFKTMLTELKIMGYLGSHANIVSLLGAYTVNIRKREVYMALEFCGKGDLLNFLKNNQERFQDWVSKISESTEIKSNLETAISMSNPITATVVAGNSMITICNPEANSAVDVFSTLKLLKWSIQIASGMEFIASKKVIHGDLAARNVLLTEQNVAKISDFGLSRQLENYAFYMKSSKTPVPWRWMAIESLRDMKFSVQSDVWSFGVVLYEIFSLRTMPYAGWTWDYEFFDKLVVGHRLSAPEFGNEGVYKLMMECMQKEASERITFSQAICRLKEIKAEICQERAFNESSEYLKLSP